MTLQALAELDPTTTVVSDWISSIRALQITITLFASFAELDYLISTLTKQTRTLWCSAKRIYAARIIVIEVIRHNSLDGY